MTIALTLAAPLATISLNSEFLLFAAAGVVSVAAFIALILFPALGSFSRGWEKLAAGVLSLFVFAALILTGLVIGFVVFYNWDSIHNLI